VDLNGNWTITPTLMGQHTRANGNFAVDPSIAGDLSTARYYPDGITDEWWQAALTAEGKISNLRHHFRSGYLKRDDHTPADYTDYSFLYDKQTTYIAYFTNDAGALIDPFAAYRGPRPLPQVQQRAAHHHAQGQSAALRRWPCSPSASSITSCRNYLVDQLPTDQVHVNGWPQTLWLTDQIRVDRDYAGVRRAELRPHA